MQTPACRVHGRRRPLKGGVSVVFRCAGYHSPFRWLTHLHDPSERLQARFFECFGNGLESLLIGCMVK